MKRITWPILLTLLVSACQSEAGKISTLPSPEQPSPINTELVQNSPAVTSNGLNPSLELSRPLETSTPIENAAPAVEPAVKQTEEISPSVAPSAAPGAALKAIDEGVLPTEEPTVTPMVTINGLYEGTYFRGLDSAPVTMIDYSDFL